MSERKWKPDTISAKLISIGVKDSFLYTLGFWLDRARYFYKNGKLQPFVIGLDPTNTYPSVWGHCKSLMAQRDVKIPRRSIYRFVHWVKDKGFIGRLPDRDLYLPERSVYLQVYVARVDWLDFVYQFYQWFENYRAILEKRKGEVTSA